MSIPKVSKYDFQDTLYYSGANSIDYGDSVLAVSDALGIYQSQFVDGYAYLDRVSIHEIATADVLTLNSSPISLVASPGSDWVLMPNQVWGGIDYNSAAYATNTALRLKDSTLVDGQHYFANTVLLPSTADVRGIMAAAAASGGVIQFAAAGAIQLYVPNGNPTAGNSDLTITMVHKVIHKDLFAL